MTQQLVDINAVKWEELKQYIYFTDGSLRDIYVPYTTRDDQRKWVSFINAAYRVLFTNGEGGRRELIDFEAVLNYWNSHGAAAGVTATFFVGETGVNCHFFADEEIENDIDPRQVNCYAAHLQLMDYLVRVSHALGKPVVLTQENDPPSRAADNWYPPLITVDNDQILVHRYWLAAS